MLPKVKDFLTEQISIKDIHSAFPDAEKAHSMPGKTARQSGHHNLQKQMEYNIYPGKYRYIGTAYGHHHFHSKSPSGTERIFHHEQMPIAKNGAAKYAHTGVYHGQHMEELGNVPGSDMTEKKEIKEVFSDAIHIKKGTVQKVPKSSPDDSEIWIARHPNGKVHYTKDKKWAHAWAAGTAKELDKPNEWKKKFNPPGKLHEYTEPNHFLSRGEPEDGQIKSAEFLKDIPQVLPKDESQEQAIKEGMENLEPGKHIYLGQGGEVRHPDKSQKHYYLAHHREKGLALFGHDNKDVVELRAQQYAANGAHYHLQEAIYWTKNQRHKAEDRAHHDLIAKMHCPDCGNHDPDSLYLGHMEHTHTMKATCHKCGRDIHDYGDEKDAVEMFNDKHIHQSHRDKPSAKSLTPWLHKEDANLLAREDEMNPGTHRRNKNGTFSGAHPSSGKIRHFWSPDAAKSFASGKKYEIPMEVRNKIARMALDSYKKKHGLTMKNEDKLAPPLFMVP